MLNKRLSTLAEEEALLSMNRQVFESTWDAARDQLLTLVLLGQLEIAKNPEGMLVG